MRLPDVPDHRRGAVMRLRRPCLVSTATHAGPCRPMPSVKLFIHRCKAYRLLGDPLQMKLGQGSLEPGQSGVTPGRLSDREKGAAVIDFRACGFD